MTDNNEMTTIDNVSEDQKKPNVFVRAGSRVKTFFTSTAGKTTAIVAGTAVAGVATYVLGMKNGISTVIDVIEGASYDSDSSDDDDDFDETEDIESDDDTSESEDFDESEDE